MYLDFAKKAEYTKFLDNLREGEIGEQSKIYYDDKNGEVIKIFELKDISLIQRKAAKLRALMELENFVPRAALPKKIIRLQGKCIGYTMTYLKGCVSLKKFQFKSRNNTADKEEVFRIACKLAEYIKDLHSKGIVIGDFHANQFMTKNGEIYVCDTDTWGITSRGRTFEADRVGRPEYIDPIARNFSEKGIFVKGYTKETDCFSLAVVIFEMLVGYNPFDGIYPLVRDYGQPLKALNRISIIGNHDLKKIDSFKIEHVAWMSEELQRDFLRIFEGKDRFNILNSLKMMEKDLKRCKKGHFYNSSRYFKCPICRISNQDALEEFRTYHIRNISYKRYAMFPDNEVRKVIDNFTYFDYNQKAIFVGGNKKAIKRKVNDRVEAMYFIGDEITITIERKKLTKSFRYFFDAEYQFSQKNKNLWGSDNPICNLEIRTQFAEKRIYLDEVLRKSFRIKVSGHYVFYVNQGNKLIKVDAFVHPCAKSIMYSGKNPFIYEVNKNGDCCICSINSAGYLEVNINGQIHKQLSGQFPRTIMYDDVKKSWCIITKKSKENGYETYVINNTGMVSKEFGKFSFGGINLKNCIFYNGMIVVPAKKRIMFLKSGTTVAESTVAQLNIGVVDKDSEISIEEDTKSDRTYLFIKNNTQVYKIPLNKV